MMGRRRRPWAGRLLPDLGLVVLAGIVLVGVVLARLVPLAGGSTLVVVGGSMEPAIPAGAAIVIGAAAPHDVAVGDVVSVRTTAASATFTHRVTRLVERDGERWLETKGDANPDADPALVPAASVIGRVELTVPYAGYVLRLLSTPFGVVFVVSLAAMLVVARRLLGTWTAEGAVAAAGRTVPARRSVRPAVAAERSG
jgi:signal peptidase